MEDYKSTLRFLLWALAVIAIGFTAHAQNHHYRSFGSFNGCSFNNGFNTSWNNGCNSNWGNSWNRGWGGNSINAVANTVGAGINLFASAIRYSNYYGNSWNNNTFCSTPTVVWGNSGYSLNTVSNVSVAPQSSIIYLQPTRVRRACRQVTPQVTSTIIVVQPQQQQSATQTCYVTYVDWDGTLKTKFYPCY